MAKHTLSEKASKAAVVSKFKVKETDTGSPEVQVALLTSRINELTEHLQKHKKDYSSQRGLLKMVGTRRRLLDYLKSTHSDRYVKLINGLDLRK